MEWEEATKSRGPALSVLFAVREDLYDAPGGDTVQVVNTAAALRALGVSVVVSSGNRVAPEDFDCVHLWHLERVHETYVHLLCARQAKKPVVLSPIYWPRDRISRCGPDGQPFRLRSWCEDAKNVCRYLAAGSPWRRHAITVALRAGWGRCRKEILASADVILPNSQAEAAMLERESGRRLPCRVVPNGVNRLACEAARRLPREQTGPEVLCVGHFDLRKNQLRVILALRPLDVLVTFVGQARPMHQAYYRCCRHLAGPRMRFLGAMDQAHVLERMRRARVHVCASHFETPGLVNLEAAAMGCSLALADCPPVREYFRDEAIYFGSRHLDGIRAAVLAALRQPPPPGLAQRVMAEYNWRLAAETTLQAYRDAVGNHRRWEIDVRRAA
jgi:glycosyltransferase involved in cell wall biosynthesis